MIDAYRFGEITIDGIKYTSDVIIFPDRVKSDWWRKEGHSLHPSDLEEVIKEKPSKLIVGCGAYSMMDVPESTRDWLKSLGIEMITLDSKNACDEYNRSYGQEGTVGCFHLTC